MWRLCAKSRGRGAGPLLVAISSFGVSISKRGMLVFVEGFEELWQVFASLDLAECAFGIE